MSKHERKHTSSHIQKRKERFNIPPSPIDLRSIAEKVGLGDIDPTEIQTRDAVLYKELLWTIANVFSDGRFKMTRAEYVQPRVAAAKQELMLTMDFTDKTFSNFQAILEKNPSLLPQDVRNTFDVYIGFSSGDRWNIHWD